MMKSKKMRSNCTVSLVILLVINLLPYNKQLFDMVKNINSNCDYVFSASCVIKTKQKEDIIKQVFRISVSVLGSHKKFLVDNGGEFYNEDFHSLCENVNICILTIRRKPSSEVVANNIVMHTVRQAFIQSQSSDRIKRALQYQTRTSGGVRYFTGDTVYYKRENNSQ